jgi:hypothetical protein
MNAVLMLQKVMRSVMCFTLVGDIHTSTCETYLYRVELFDLTESVHMLDYQRQYDMSRVSLQRQHVCLLQSLLRVCLVRLLVVR